jgi:hypothetical protein
MPIIFGDLNDPDCEVVKLVATHCAVTHKPVQGAIPQVCYIRPERANTEQAYRVCDPHKLPLAANIETAVATTLWLGRKLAAPPEVTAGAR